MAKVDSASANPVTYPGLSASAVEVENEVAVNTPKRELYENILLLSLVNLLVNACPRTGNIKILLLLFIIIVTSWYYIY